MKYCLSKGIPFIARWQNPGRLAGMVLRKNTSAEQAHPTKHSNWIQKGFETLCKKVFLARFRKSDKDKCK
jgi:hypothetical protein